jgi:hypothetical protein
MEGVGVGFVRVDLAFSVSSGSASLSAVKRRWSVGLG